MLEAVEDCLRLEDKRSHPTGVKIKLGGRAGSVIMQQKGITSGRKVKEQT